MNPKNAISIVVIQKITKSSGSITISNILSLLLSTTIPLPIAHNLMKLTLATKCRL